MSILLQLYIICKTENVILVLRMSAIKMLWWCTVGTCVSVKHNSVHFDVLRNWKKIMMFNISPGTTDKYFIKFTKLC